MELTSELLSYLAEVTPGNKAIYQIRDGRIILLCRSRALSDALDLDADEYDRIVRRDATDLVVPDDLPGLREAVQDCVRTKGKMDRYWRVLQGDKSFVWVHGSGSYCGELDGYPVVLIIYGNATDGRNLYKDVVDNSQTMAFVCDCGTYEVLYANLAAREYGGDAEANLLGRTCYAYIQGRDEPCADCIMKTTAPGKTLNQDRFNASHGTWEHISGKHIEWFGRDAFIQYVQDITDSKIAQRKLEDAEQRYAVAVQGANLGVWEYRIKEHVIVGGNESFGKNGLPYRIENVPDSLIPRFGEENRTKLDNLYRRVEAGEPELTETFWWRPFPDKPPICERLYYTVVKDEQGLPDVAYGVSMNVTEQMLERERFQRAMQSMLSANPDALSTFELNLTQNLNRAVMGTSPYILRQLDTKTADDIFENARSEIVDEASRKDFEAVFARAALLDAFAAGKGNRHVDIRRCDDSGKQIWVRVFINMLRNPETDDVEAVVYSLDVSKEKQNQLIYDLITNEEHDFVALLHTADNKAEFLNLSDRLSPEYRAKIGKTGQRFDYCEARRLAAEESVVIDERDEFLRKSSVEVIKDELNRNDHYEFIVSGHWAEQPEIALCRKIKTFYLDEVRDTILIVETDVTEAFLQQRREIERTQREAEQTLVDTVGSLPTCSILYVEAADGTLAPLRYSDEFCRLKGCTQENIAEFNGADGFAPVHPDDREALREAVDACRGDDRMHHAVYRILTKDRGYCWVSANYAHFAMEGRRYLYVAYTDIDDLKKQEQQLEEQYNSAQMFLDSVSGTYIATRRVNLTKDEVEAVKGISPLPKVAEKLAYDASLAELLRAMPREQDRRDNGARLSREALIEAYRNGTRELSCEYQYRAQDGGVRWAHHFVTLSKRPGSGDIIAFSAVSDITDEKLAGAIMDEAIVKQYDYLCCIDAESGRILLFLSQGSTLGNLTPAPGMDYEKAMRTYNARFVDEADRDACTEFMSLAHVTRMLEDAERCVTSCSLDEGSGPRAKQIEFFYVDRENHLIGLSRTDYTEAQQRQIEQEEKLREALAAAETANAAKSDFLSRMSHDIRTPLNGIIGITYLAQGMGNSPQMVDYLHKIDTSSKFLLGLINDVLDMSKAESGKLELHPEPYVVKDFLEYLDSVIVPLCREKGLKFVVDAHATPGVAVMFDPLRLNQIFFNLLSNAVKYTPEGGTVTYRLREERISESRLSVTGQVIDTGIGMSEEFQKVLFEPFTQENRRDVSESRGTGLGLAIVKKIIDAMGGTIAVESEVGKGTTFTLHVEADCIPLEEATGGQKGTTVSHDDFGALAGRHVLLCEDHPLNQEIAEKMLEQEKVNVEVAEDGSKGLDMFVQSPLNYYDAILMDIRMPVMDGYEATRQIRALDRPDARSIPIIAMTADAFVEDVRKCFDVGMNDHIAKPIDPGRLYAALLSAIEPIA